MTSLHEQAHESWGSGYTQEKKKKRKPSLEGALSSSVERVLWLKDVS